MLCRYGVGYHMTIVKEASCSSSRVAEVVQSMVSQAEQVTDVGAELSFILPSSATPHFPQLFDTLEGRGVGREGGGREGRGEGGKEGGEGGREGGRVEGTREYRSLWF